ncbi:MAG TPA: hypothetical protein VJT67_04780 [Longimicrobiaceae bacterium]|nr:hypothetical protein [Longimicrobiaceae bacterium]
MNAAPADDRIRAQGRLETVTGKIYADPPAALLAMREDAQRLGADAVRRRLEDDFTRYGDPADAVQGPARDRVQNVLRDSGLAADMERWLAIDRPTPTTEIVTGGELDVPATAPEPPVTAPAPAPRAGRPGDPRDGLNAEERLAYDQLEAFAEAKERADRWQTAEARLHAIYDHRDNLAAAAEKIPAARDALRREVDVAFTDGEGAMKQIDAAMRRDGPADTARRIRSGEMLAKEQRKITAPTRRLGVIPQRDHAAETEIRERVAQRIETIGFYEGDLGKWSTFQPQDGQAVQGAKNVRAALDREEAQLVADSGIGRVREQAERTRATPVHPSVEASQLARAAQLHLDRLPPESRERVIQAAERSGVGRMSAAVSHLQTIQMAARTLREGIEPPGH